MRNFLRRFLPLFILVVFVACDDDKDSNPFVGNDKNIVSFALTVNGVEYKAAIIDTKVVMTVPADVDLEHAEANVQISEQASILPDPATIKNWDEDQVFRVSSYSGSYIAYTYTVARSEITSVGNVTLNTQAEVDNFASNISVIDGNLVIGNNSVAEAEDPIVNLDALAAIEQVKYKIIINPSYAGANLAGLANVKSIGGFQLGTMTTEVAPKNLKSIELSSLETAGDFIVNNNILTSVSASKLKSVATFYINSSSLIRLDISKIESCIGDFTVQGSTRNSVLPSILLPNLQEVYGNVKLDKLYAVEELDLSGMKFIDGDMTITYLQALSAVSMPVLANFKGNISVQQYTQLKKIELPSITEVSSLQFVGASSNMQERPDIDLSSLVCVTGIFTLQNGIKSLKADALKTVGGNLTISATGFEQYPLANVKEYGGVLSVKSEASMETINLTQAQRIGDLSVTSCSSLTDILCPDEITGSVELNMGRINVPIPNLKGLKTVGGNFTVSNVSTTLAAMELGTIKQVKGKLTIPQANKLVVVTLPDLEQVGHLYTANAYLEQLDIPSLKSAEQIELLSMMALKTLSFPQLKEVTTKINMTGKSYASAPTGSSMDNVDCFANAAKVGEVSIQWFAKMNDFSGFEKAFSNTEKPKWAVSGCEYNPSLADMTAGNYIKK